MRIIAGKYRGRRISAPRGTSTRPTTDRVRESLFSILGDLTGLIVWDMCAGSGALGLEALSRGAEFAYFTDSDPKAISTIRSNIMKLEVSSTTKVIRGNFPSGMKWVDRPLDLLFFDPPYDSNLYINLFETLSTSNHLHHNSLIVVEHRSSDQINLPENSCFIRDDYRVYGSTAISFYYIENR